MRWAAAQNVLSRCAQWATELNKSLAEVDPELCDVIEREKRRQRDNVVLIASEVRHMPPPPRSLARCHRRSCVAPRARRTSRRVRYLMPEGP